ncbi:MAG: DUF177 domain-containing protein [Pseudomonadota bacterium]
MTAKATELDPIPFSVPLDTTSLHRDAAHPLEVMAPDALLGEIAAYLGVDAVWKIHLNGQLTAWGEAGWRAEGRLSAELTQTCVVTLGPVKQEISEEITRHYLPANLIGDSADITVDLDEDAPDPFTGSIDLGALMLEELALVIDPYPRADGAELETRIFAAPGIAPMTDEDARPFAKLSELRGKLSGLK